MNNALSPELRTQLQFSIPETLGKKAPLYLQRNTNIKFIRNLPYSELASEKREKELLVYKTRTGERIFLRFPGSESLSIKKKNPWDFRPVGYPPNSDLHGIDLTFGQVWETILENAKSLNEQNIRTLAVLLCRMAFMYDHIHVPNKASKIREITYEGEDRTVHPESDFEIKNVYLYTPPRTAIDLVASQCPIWRNMSLEAFLYYLEMISWGEDSKYHYLVCETGAKKSWLYSTGRVNNVLTHLRVLGFCLKHATLADIFDDFARRRGISAANKKEIRQICGGFVS